MVLTEKQDTSFYPAATMETAQATTEEALYANLPETRTPISTVAGYPTDNTTSPNNEVAQVSGNGQKIGPSITLKVMAGDKFNIKVSSWYQTNGADPQSPNSSLTDLVAALINGLSGPAGASHGNVTAAGLQNSGVITPDATDFLNNQPDPGSKPKAYLNWILFDEQFKMVAASSGAEQVGDDGEFKQHVKTDLPVTKNGYLYVYVSNETPNINVFFDNLQVTHIHGQIMEETHYYPFGLTMAGISSKAALGLENKYKYNGIELDTSLGLDEYEAQLRDLDPQLGRWWQVDPETEDQEMWSPYTSNYDNPILYKDPRGNEGEDCCGGIIQLGEEALNIYRAVRSGENILDAAQSNPITWKTVARGIFKALEGPEDLRKVNPKDLPINKDSKTVELTLPPDTHVLIQPADTKVKSKAEERAAKLSEKVRSGKDFTKAGKNAVKNVNKEKNNGEMVCENCGTGTQNASKHTRGQTPPSNEAHVDHIDPKSNGGSGTPDNGQVLCRDCNLKKGAN